MGFNNLRAELDQQQLRHIEETERMDKDLYNIRSKNNKLLVALGATAILLLIFVITTVFGLMRTH